MGYSQGKMLKPDDLQNQSLLSKDSTNEKQNYAINENYKIISKTNKKNVDCIIIEFLNNENKQVDCEISLNRINFEEAYEMDFIFDSVIKVFENMGINLPFVIYLNFENARINIFLKLKSVDEIIVITNKFISLIKNFNKLMKFSNDIDYKVHKKPEIQSNYSPLNSNNSYINCFANPSKGAKVNSSFNNTDNLSANQNKILPKEKIEINNVSKTEVSSKKEFIELISNNNEKTNKDNIALSNRKRVLTFDNTINPNNPSTNITNETFIYNNSANCEISGENLFAKNTPAKAEILVRESSNKKLRIQTEIEENLINSKNIKEEKISCEKEKTEAKENKYELSEEELERMDFMDQNKEMFENRDLIMQQPEEEMDKLVNELLINRLSAASTDNLLLNENFLNSENTMNRFSFDDGENNHNNIPANSTANNIIERSLNHKNIGDFGSEDQNKMNPPVGKLSKNMKFTFDDLSFDNPKDENLNSKNNDFNNNNIDFKEKENKLNEILLKHRLLQNKETLTNQDNGKNLNNKPDITNKNGFYKRNISENNPKYIANHSKNPKRFSFPVQQDIPSNQSNIALGGNLEIHNSSALNNSNNFDDKMNGVKNQNTRNYYINNILNFNPNNNFSENPKMQNISNINAIMNPSLINHNVLMMMKKFNQNSQINNNIFNHNLVPNQLNNYGNNQQIIPTNFNNNFANLNNISVGQINNANKAFTNNFDFQAHDLNNKNYFINNNLNSAIMNPYNNYNSSLERNNESYNFKEYAEKIVYLEDKVKIISLEEDSLEGFYFKKTDFISDEDFISLYFIGNPKNLVLNNKKDSGLIDSEIKESYTNILSKFFKDRYNLKLKHIIQNPSESDSLSRLVFYKRHEANETNGTQIFKETDGLEHEKISINNHSFILIRIKSLVLKLHPEELYIDLQLKLNYEINNFDERDFVNFLENTLRIDFFEISFLTEGECVLTFYEREALKELINIFQQKPYHQIKRPLKKVKIETAFLNEPFPIQGKKINLLYDDEEEEGESEKAQLPQRPPVRTRVLAGNYTPTLKKLLSTKEIWSGYKIEKHNFDVVNVEQFHNEICKCDFEIIKSTYSENPDSEENQAKNIVFTILDYSRKPKKIKKQLKKIIDDENEEEEEIAKRESNKNANDKPNINTVNNNNKTYYNAKDLKEEMESGSEVEFSSSDGSESSFSIKNFEESDLDLDENNQTNENKKYSSHMEPEVKVYKKRGRKPKIQLISEENHTNSACKSSSNRNDYGKKFISNNFRRSYNHSRYNVNNLQLETTIDPSKPNILDEIIKNNLNNREKILLEKIEKEVEEKIFKKNTSSNDFLPRKRGRKAKGDSIENFSANPNNLNNSYSNKVPFKDQIYNSNKGYNEISESENYEDYNSENYDDEKKSQQNIDQKTHFIKWENSFNENQKESDFVSKNRSEQAQLKDNLDKDLGESKYNYDIVEEKNSVQNELNTLDNLKSTCIDEDLIDKILSRKDD